jgi:hypothetical protein
MKVEIFGITELNELFDELKNSQKKGIILNAFKKVGRPILNAIKQAAKTTLNKKTGNLMSSFGIVSLNSKNGIKIGARKTEGYKGFHGHFFDAGTQERKTKKGYKRGAIKATHYFSDAVKSNSDTAINEFQNELDKSFSSFVLKFNAKNKTK